MKAIYLIGIGIFWTAVIILGTAGLVSYEQGKDATTPDAGTPDVRAVADAVAQGATVWNEALVAQHSATDDCWIIVNGGIYDVTEFVPFHPGGEQAILPYCGKEASEAFTTRGGDGRHSQSAWSQLERYYIATLGTAAPATTAPTGTTPAAGAVSPTSAAATSYEAAIQKKYTEAVITDINVEDDGRAEVKFIYEGEEYEAKLDASYNILEAKRD